MTPPCECDNGFRPVTEAYARQEAGIAQDADLAAYRAAPLGTDEADRWSKFWTVLNSVFPCPSCRPRQFERWHHGCFRPGHVAKRCNLCKSAGAA